MFLSFAWKSSDSTQENYYVFTVLPFELSTAPYIFTKLVKLLEMHWRLLNIEIASFLDDGWSAEKNFQLCHSNAQQVLQDLADSGFISNDFKSVWEPSQQIEWLGLLWNSRKGSLSLIHRCVEVPLGVNWLR